MPPTKSKGQVYSISWLKVCFSVLLAQFLVAVTTQRTAKDAFERMR